MPTFTIVAGPNGSGKTTLTTLVREAFQSEPILDPDAIGALATGVSGATSLMDAGREALALAESLLNSQQSFVAETTFSGHTYLRMMQRAKARGYRTVLIFVGTERVEINMERIRQRVRFGGHDVSEEDQRRRFPRSFANLSKAASLADELLLFDNSGDAHRLIAARDEHGLRDYSARPEWSEGLV